jgi:uncharacterized protein with HEPN domain
VSRLGAERLTDIAAAIDRIRAHVGRLEDARIDSSLITDGVVYNLLVIGEAVKALDDAILAVAPDVPWADVAGMRDILAHHYFNVDRGIIERTVRKDLAPLDAAVRRLLAEMGLSD